MISFNYLASPGQLGNQMFKYAALKGIANANKQDFLLPPSYLFLNNRTLFKIARKLKIVDNKSRANHLLFKYFKMNSVKKNNIGFADFKESLNEDGFEFNPNFFEIKKNKIDINGYFQSYKYFESIKESVIKDFEFKKLIKIKSTKIKNKFEDPISIHVRRGDFVTNPNHNALDLEYYYKCIELLGNNEEYIIFSDDTKWCKNISLFKKNNFYFASDYTNESESLDLCLMSMCSRHIIANSTFSWWGAWLSQSEQVYAPKDWFKNTKYQDYDTKDLYPINWRRVEN